MKLSIHPEFRLIIFLPAGKKIFANRSTFIISPAIYTKSPAKAISVMRKKKLKKNATSIKPIIRPRMFKRISVCALVRFPAMASLNIVAIDSIGLISTDLYGAYNSIARSGMRPLSHVSDWALNDTVLSISPAFESVTSSSYCQTLNRLISAALTVNGLVLL